jgi:pantoate--beta-alanine ligase
MSSPPIVETIADLRARTGQWRNSEAARIGLVPTMGALHEGHLSLVREMKTRVGRVVVSIFVNPAQFAPHEDFDRYPRAMEDDLANLATTGADLVSAPAWPRCTR